MIKLGAVTPLKVTAMTFSRFVPLMETLVFPSTGPVPGSTFSSVGWLTVALTLISADTSTARNAPDCKITIPASTNNHTTSFSQGPVILRNIVEFFIFRSA
jgi:hypothetical protein